MSVSLFQNYWICFFIASNIALSNFLFNKREPAASGRDLVLIEIKLKLARLELILLPVHALAFYPLVGLSKTSTAYRPEVLTIYL